MTTFFITSSGTEIGKTFVASMLLQQLDTAGYSRAAIKPIASGFDIERAVESDTGLLLLAQGLAVSEGNIERVSPWRLRAPLSPDMAAEREHVEIEFADVLAFCQRERNVDVTLIEGVGGVMAPIGRHHTIADLIETLAVPVLLVVGSYLGSISHALTASAVLEARSIDIAGVVVNESPVQPVSTVETARTLQRFLPTMRILVLPKKRAGDDPSHPDLMQLIAPYLNPDASGAPTDR